MATDDYGSITEAATETVDYGVITGAVTSTFDYGPLFTFVILTTPPQRVQMIGRAFRVRMIGGDAN